MHLKSIFLVLLSLLLISCGESKTDKIIESYSDDLTNATLATDAQRQYSVYANYNDGSKQNITNSLLWSSSDENLTTVVNGLVESNIMLGDVNISYETYDKLSDGLPSRAKNITLNIKKLTVGSIELHPSSSEISITKNVKLEVSATYVEDNSTARVTKYCNFNSSNPAIATVDSSGLVNGVTEGNTTIIATHRDTNLTSNSEITVIAVHYRDLKIVADKKEFNVEQTIALQAEAKNNNNENVILKNSDLIWSSSDSDVISIGANDGVVKALKKGTAIITAVVKSTIDSQTPSTTLELSVLKDEYMRLFDKDGNELSFDTPVDNYFEKGKSNYLDEFTLKAVGKEFRVSHLRIENFTGLSIEGNQIVYINLTDADTIFVDTNRTFKLNYDEQTPELIYSFKINDSVGSTFIQRYIEETN